MGPVEFVAIGFPGNRFSGEIMPALRKAVEQGTVRVVDLTFINKDAAGAVSSRELTELDEHEAALFDPLVGEITGLLSPADVEKVGAALAADSSAALLVFEHVWAAELQRAVLGARGVLLAREHIPHEVVEAALAANAA
jgi:Family of unknown function (DUF6325)